MAGPEERPPSRDASANTASEPMRTLRRPSMSPLRPPSRRRAPNVNAYPLTTQAMPLMLKPRPLWIDGSATFTIVVSRTTINCTAASRTNAPSKEFLLFDAASPTATTGRTADGPLTAVVIPVISVLPLSPRLLARRAIMTELGINGKVRQQPATLGPWRDPL